jgi:hypothetical protein
VRHFLKPPASGRKEIGMKLVPITPPIYRFIPDEPGFDAKFLWSWCLLAELHHLLRKRGFVPNGSNPKEVIREHLHLGTGIKKRTELHLVTIVSGEAEIIRITTSGSLGFLIGIEPESILVPTGWAEAVIRRKQATHALLETIFPGKV